MSLAAAKQTIILHWKICNAIDVLTFEHINSTMQLRLHRSLHHIHLGSEFFFENRSPYAKVMTKIKCRICFLTTKTALHLRRYTCIQLWMNKNDTVRVLTGMQAVFIPSFVVISLQTRPRVGNFWNCFLWRRWCVRRWNARSSLHWFYTVARHHSRQIFTIGNEFLPKTSQRQDSLCFRQAPSIQMD